MSHTLAPVAGAYGLMAVMDDSFEGFNDVYFEGGDHRTLVHVTGQNFHWPTCRTHALVRMTSQARIVRRLT